MNSYKKAYNSLELEKDIITKEKELFDKLIKDHKSTKPEKNAGTHYYLNYFFEDKYRQRLNYLENEKIEFETFHDQQNQNEIVEENQQLSNIQAELIKFYALKPEDFFAVNNESKKERIKLSKSGFDYVDSNGKRHASHRARYLVWKYNSLYAHLAEKNKLKPVDAQQESTEKNKEDKSLFLSSFKQSFDIFKKIVDSMDDMWSSIGSHIFPRDIVTKVTPYLMGVVVGFIHAVEAVNGAWIACKKFSKISHEGELKPAATKEENRKRASDIVAGITGVGAAVIGSIGTALSIAAMVTSSFVLASMLPALMVGIIGTMLIRRGVRYHHAEMNYFDAKHEITDRKVNGKQIVYNNEIMLPLMLSELKKRITAEEEKTNPNQDKLKEMYEQYFELDRQLTHIQRLKEKYEDKKFTFWFNVAELLAGLAVAVGVVVGTGASLGTLSAILGGVGVGSAITTKVVEYLNEEHHVFKRLSNWFSPEVDNKPQIEETTDLQLDTKPKKTAYTDQFIAERLNKTLDKAGTARVQTVSTATTTVPTAPVAIAQTPPVTKPLVQSTSATPHSYSPRRMSTTN